MSRDSQAETRARLLPECRALFDQWERMASSRAATGLMFVWAVAEATVWPVIPDFLLVLVAAGNRRRFYVPLAAAVLGSALGGSAIFLVAYWASEPAFDFLQQIPLVSDAQIQDAARSLDDHGAVALLLQPWSGIPFKVWGVMAGIQGLDPWFVIPAFIVGRAVRMAIVAALARVVAGTFTGFFRDFSLFLLAGYLALFFVGWWLTQVAG